jgi:pyruvate formate lyase activating enzyme
MQDPLITEIQRFSLQDGPGIRTTIFIKGCPLKCPWCHNPETQLPIKEFYYHPEKCVCCGKCVEVCPSNASTISFDAKGNPVLNIDRNTCVHCMKCVEICPAGAREIVGQQLQVRDILQEAVSDSLFYKNSGGGVTLSGGDPLLFPEFTLMLTKLLKRELVHVAIETSCFAPWEKIEPLLAYMDLFIVDIKTMDAEKHRSIVGWPLDVILSNINKLAEHKANIRIHLPIIPEFNNSSKDFQAIIDYLAKLSDKISAVDILPYHCYAENKYTLLGRGSSYRFKGVKDLPVSAVLPLCAGLNKVGIANITIGGLGGLGTDDSSGKNKLTKGGE